MRSPVAEIVAATLADEGSAEIYAHLLDAARVAFAADQALLVRRDDGRAAPSWLHRSPADAALDAHALGDVADADGPREVAALPGAGPVLAVDLHPRRGTTWALGLARAAGAAWSPAERQALADVRAPLTLGLAFTMLREEVDAERTREAEMEVGRERLLAAVSHELRNPLAPILMWTSTLRRLRGQDDELLRAMQAIEHAVALERRLIEDLADVSRLERHVLELRCEPLDLREVVAQAIDQYRRELEERALSLVRDVPQEPVPVDGDRKRLVQVLGNLIGNAVKFAPDRGTVAVRLGRRGECAEVRVSDTGPGLVEELRPRLFTPFVQGRNARGGLGVGLAVARWLVELHGGAIEALPAGDLGGTTIVVTVPLGAPWQRARAAG